MSSPEQVRGACLCGAVRLTVTMPTLFCGHCHCTMCRRNHGAAYVTWIAVPHAQVTIDAGAGELIRYQSSEHGSRSFCRRCGSSLLCVSERHPEIVDIPLANLEGTIDRLPESHFYFDDRAAWTRVADDLPCFGGRSGLEPLG
jgi:hypothetical protein